MHSLPTHPRTLFRIVSIATLSVTITLNAGVNDPAATPDPLQDPAVIEAIRTVWNYTLLGRFGIEASFRLDGSPSGYKVLVAPLTNQFRRQKVVIFPGVTFALFHVHTAKAEPAPSAEDRKIADQYKLSVYTIHLQGLHVYDPVTKKTTKLREGVKWLTLKPENSGKPLKQGE